MLCWLTQTAWGKGDSAGGGGHSECCSLSCVCRRNTKLCGGCRRSTPSAGRSLANSASQLAPGNQRKQHSIQLPEPPQLQPRQPVPRLAAPSLPCSVGDATLHPAVPVQTWAVLGSLLPSPDTTTVHIWGLVQGICMLFSYLFSLPLSTALSGPGMSDLFSFCCLPPAHSFRQPMSPSQKSVLTAS